MAPNNSILVAGIQKVGYRAGTPFRFSYKIVVPDRALEVASLRAYCGRCPVWENPGTSAICTHQVGKRIRAHSPYYQHIFISENLWSDKP